MTRRVWKILGIIGMLVALTTGIWLVRVPPPVETASPDDYAIYAVSVQAMHTETVARVEGMDASVNVERSDGARFSDTWIANAPFSVRPHGAFTVSPIRMSADQRTAFVRIELPGCVGGAPCWCDLTLLKTEAGWTIGTKAYDR